MERGVVRSFGTVAAVAAAALALLIGFLAFSAHQNQQNAARPPGSQATAPVTGHGTAAAQSARFSGSPTVGSGARSNAASSSRGEGGMVYVAPSGGTSAGTTATFSGAGTGSVAAAAPACSNVVQSLLGLVSSLLGGAGC